MLPIFIQGNIPNQRMLLIIWDIFVQINFLEKIFLVQCCQFGLFETPAMLSLKSIVQLNTEVLTFVISK